MRKVVTKFLDFLELDVNNFFRKEKVEISLHLKNQVSKF
jgi:hypothetical protein